MQITRDNHYILAVLVVHGFVRASSLRGTQRDLDRFQTTYNSIKSALYVARSCGEKPQGKGK